MGGLAIGIALTTLFLGAMLAGSVWTNRQLPACGPVAIHFNIRGEADGFGSRWLILALLPAIYTLTSAFVLWVSAATASTLGERLASVLLLGASMVAAHGFCLWLLIRWARDRTRP